MTVSPLQPSSTAVSADKSNNVETPSPVDSFCTTAALDKEVGHSTRSLDNVTNDYSDTLDASISNEKHEWRETWVGLPF